MGIPKEWPEEGEQRGHMILNAMRIALPQHIENKAKAVRKPVTVPQMQRVAVAIPGGY